MGPREQRHVLFVEDDALMRRLLSVILGGEVCVARQFRAGEDAFTVVRRDKFDGILLDLQHVNRTGLEIQGRILSVKAILVGRVLVINAEVADRETAEAIISHCVRRSRPAHFLPELWHRLCLFMGLPRQTGATR